MGRYKKMYNLGGAMTPTKGLTNGTAMAAGLANPLFDMLDQGNKFGRQSGVATGLKQGASMAAAGASVGGPVGAIIGGGLGLATGLIGSIGAKKREQELQRKVSKDNRFASEQAGMLGIRQDPTGVNGSRDQGFFKNGGSLQENYLGSGPQIKELSNQSVEIQGPKHEQGGVMLPGNNEVEGGETISEGFVYSEELGFAKAHKPIAKAIGKLEDKPLNPIRRKTMIKLKERETELAQAQEALKEQLNIH